MRLFILLTLTLPRLFSRAMSIRTRKLLLMRQGDFCANCGDKFGTMIPHEVHHINHDPTDNRLFNLVMLCPNCHAAHHRHNVTLRTVDWNGES